MRLAAKQVLSRSNLVFLEKALGATYQLVAAVLCVVLAVRCIWRVAQVRQAVIVRFAVRTETCEVDAFLFIRKPRSLLAGLRAPRCSAVLVTLSLEVQLTSFQAVWLWLLQRVGRVGSSLF
jgi:hypothetical protein